MRPSVERIDFKDLMPPYLSHQPLQLGSVKCNPSTHSFSVYTFPVA